MVLTPDRMCRCVSDCIGERRIGRRAPEGGVLSLHAQIGVRASLVRPRAPRRAVETENREASHHQQDAHHAEDGDDDDVVNVHVIIAGGCCRRSGREHRHVNGFKA